MKCFYQFISYLGVSDNREFFNFNIIADGNLPQLQYFGHANPWKFRNLATETNLKTITYEEFPTKIPGISWGKYCTETKDQLSAAYKLFSTEVNRQKEEQKNLNPDISQIYPDCIKKLEETMKQKPYTSISTIRTGQLPSCTVKIVLKNIVKGTLEILYPAQEQNQVPMTKPRVIVDTAIIAEELLDTSQPAISLVFKNKEIHLVFVSGYLKVVKCFNPNKIYKTSISHSDNLYSRVYHVIEQAEKNPGLLRTISLRETSIELIEK